MKEVVANISNLTDNIKPAKTHPKPLSQRRTTLKNISSSPPSSIHEAPGLTQNQKKKKKKKKKKKMQVISIQPCKSPSLPLRSFHFLHKQLESSSFPKSQARSRCRRSWVFSESSSILRRAHLGLCSRSDGFDGLSSTAQFADDADEDLAAENRELGLLDKPFPVARDESDDDSVDEKAREEEALAPFLKFFNMADGQAEEEGEGKSVVDEEEEEERPVGVEYYEPKPGDFVVGVVVSGNENKLDVNVGADFLGTMLTKEVLPLYDREMETLLCDPSVDAEEFYTPGKMGVVKYDEAVGASALPGRPVVEAGTVLFAEVLGRTLSGRPLLSTRRLFRRIAWRRVRQIKRLDEPVEVRITEWNTGGLLTRIEGLRAFVPKAELLKKVNNFSDLKEQVGSRMRVLLTRANEETNDLILSEKDAWKMLNLREGALLEGTVKKIFPFGAQIRIGETNRSGLLHISKITSGKLASIGDLLSVGEKVKVLVVKSMFPDKISLSIADLESEPGLFLSNKERVFSEAEVMAKKYRGKLPVVLPSGRSKSPPDDALEFEDEAKMYANWKWFKFERDGNQIEHSVSQTGSGS